MGNHAWESSEFTQLTQAYADLEATADAIATKAGESPNILVYGLFSMGIIGWWMQVAQITATDFTKETSRTLAASGAAIEATQRAYDNTNLSAMEKAEEVEQIIDTLEQEIPR
ncbi:hypothetical protein [Enemella sp. A6]|uniref:hypothetical protein n=1 Tax=Enemella sp. A6 TaxID=3440152 RepID=UPI003EBF2574